MHQTSRHSRFVSRSLSGHRSASARYVSTVQLGVRKHDRQTPHQRQHSTAWCSQTRQTDTRDTYFNRHPHSHTPGVVVTTGIKAYCGALHCVTHCQMYNRPGPRLLSSSRSRSSQGRRRGYGRRGSQTTRTTSPSSRTAEAPVESVAATPSSEVPTPARLPPAGPAACCYASLEVEAAVEVRAVERPPAAAPRPSPPPAFGDTP